MGRSVEVRLPDLRAPIDRIRSEAESVMLGLGLELEREVVDEIERRGLQVTGELKKSITTDVVRRGGQTELRVGPSVSYAVYVHEGTRPHWPPLKPIRRWVARKFTLTGKEVEKFARAVQGKIARKGTRAQPFLRTVWKRWEGMAVSRFADDLRRRLAGS